MLGPKFDLPGIVGDGQVELPLAAVDPRPPAIELSRLGIKPDLRRDLVERVLAFAELRAARWLARGDIADQRRRRALREVAVRRLISGARTCQRGSG